MQEQPVTQPTTDKENLFIVKFADSKIPEFKELRNRDFITYGEDNKYPVYLTGLFNKSAKHNAIINGKAFYIFGKGFANGEFTCNRLGESLNDVVKKIVLDIVLYGGFRLECVYNALGKICELYHASFQNIRADKNGGYLFYDDWDLYTKNYQHIPEFNPSHVNSTQIFSYNEYRPNTKYYPLPDYIGCNNYIETDIEISKFYLSIIKNGMMPSKYVQFFTGDTTDEKKQAIEKRFKNKFAGSETAGSIILEFLNDPAKATQITDLSASDLDKMFIELNKTVQQEIFSGHLVTSPMLFGIKTEGQLGGNNELQTAYGLFSNTYAEPKANLISKEIQYLLSYSIWPGVYDLEPTEPIGNQIDIKDVINSLPKEYVFKSLGIPEELWDGENIGEDNRPTPTVPQPPNNDIAPATPTNALIRNMTGRQQQQVERIMKKYKKGELEEPAAKTLLRAGLGLNEEDINSLLGIQIQMSREFTEDEIIAMFDACGDVKDDYEIIKSKRVSFEINEIESDEAIFIKEAFKTGVTATEAKILELIQKDPLITADVIATTIGQTKALVENKINTLTQRGLIESTTEAIGTDTLIKRIVTDTIDYPKAIIDDTPVSKISIKYNYDGPQDSRNRPFCAKLMQLSRLYTRADIEKISARLGYSVFDRRGGFWRHKDGEKTPYCRHNWKSNIVVQK